MEVNRQLGGSVKTTGRYQAIQETDYESGASVPAESLPPRPPGHLPTIRKLSYGVGHVFNDLCASMWFTYLVLFYHKVVMVDNTYAGLLILIGQVADAAATPIIGFFCDKTHVRYGRRKLWHLIGTVMVAVSLFFFWHTCLGCNRSPLAVKIVYFSVPIIIFQFGWASVQISHLSLIPELTSDKNERVGLNAIRYAFTILSNIGVYAAMFLLLMFVPTEHDVPKIENSTLLENSTFIPTTGISTTGIPTTGLIPLENSTGLLANSSHENNLSPSDVWIFSGTALGIIVVGLFFSSIFQIGTREPYVPPEKRETQYAEGRRVKWYLWFCRPQLYLVAGVYMSTRLMNNIIQAYTPLFLIETMKLSKTSVAIGPLVIYVVGFMTTLLLKILNKVVGRYLVYFFGIVLIWGGLVWFYFLKAPDSVGLTVLVYGSTALVGAGGAIVLVTSLSMVADLIDNATGSSAFVYGLMSFTDKLSSGVVIQIIQALHPCKEDICCPSCEPYYRHVLVFVPGAATVSAVVALALLVLLIFFQKRRQQRDLTIIPHDRYSREASINTSKSRSTTRDSSPLQPPIQDHGDSRSEKRHLLKT